MPETEWIDDIKFAKAMDPVWLRYYGDFFRGYNTEIVKIIGKDEDPRYLDQGWDKVLIFVGGHPPLRLEQKTRRHDAYTNYYLHDYKLAIEIMGNVERQKLGSSIFNSNADIWAYGFASQDLKQIIDARIFFVRPVVKWIRENLDKLVHKRAENKVGLWRGYHTESVLVSVRIIDRYLYNPDNLLHFIGGR